LTLFQNDLIFCTDEDRKEAETEPIWPGFRGEEGEFLTVLVMNRTVWFYSEA